MQWDNDLTATAAVDRWPGFAREATAAGAGATFAFPLEASGVVFGILELYRTTPGRLSAAAMGTAGEFAERATGTVLHDLTGHTDLAPVPLATDPAPGRREVHLAAGVIAGAWGMAVPEAMAPLRGAAYADGRLVVDVTRDILRGTTTMER